MDIHLKLYATQLKQPSQTQTHPLHDLNAYLNPPRNMEAAIFHNNEHTKIIISEPDITPGKCREVTDTTPYDIHSLEQILPLHMRTKLAQIRANKSPFLQSYLYTNNPETYPPLCPLCLSHTHDTNHLFNCSQVITQH